MTQVQVPDSIWEELIRVSGLTRKEVQGLIKEFLLGLTEEYRNKESEKNDGK